MKKITLTIITIFSIPIFAHAQWTNGTNINNTNSGSVGIGTTSPFKHLHVQGGNIVATTNDFNVSGTGSAIIMGQNGITGNVYSLVQAAVNGPNTPGTLSLNPNGGYIGVGTTNPFKHLHVQGGNIVATTNDFNISGTGSAIIMGQDGITGNVYSLVQAAVNGPNTPGTLSLNPNGGYIGVGTTNPFKHLHVQGGNIVATTNDFSVSGTGSAIIMGQDGITGNVYSLVQAAVNGPNTPGTLSLNPNGGSIAIGTTDAKGYKLAVNGSVVATSMTIALNSAWPDYVFKKDYQLPSLSDVKTYIDQNHHLPELPSEQEVAKNGINLGEIVKLQTKKIEELTLYLIEMKAEMKELQKQNESLRKSK